MLSEKQNDENPVAMNGKLFDPNYWDMLYQSSERVLTSAPDFFVDEILMDVQKKLSKKMFRARAKIICADFGSGLGRNTFQMLMRLGGDASHIIALDFSPAAIGTLSQAIGKRYLADQMHAAAVDLRKPMKTGAIPYFGEINTAICTDVVSVMAKPEKLLENIRSAMLQEGLLAVTIQNTDDETCGHGELQPNYSEEGFWYTYKQEEMGFRFYTKKGIQKLIEMTGWKIRSLNTSARVDPPHEQRPEEHNHCYFDLLLEKK